MITPEERRQQREIIANGILDIRPKMMEKALDHIDEQEWLLREWFDLPAASVEAWEKRIKEFLGD